MSKESIELSYLIETMKKEIAFGRSLSTDRETVRLPIDAVEKIIEQAERTNALELEVERANNKANYFKKEHNELVGVGGMWINVSNKLQEVQDQNKLYREAMFEAVDIAKNNILSSPACSDIEVILSEVLEIDIN